MPTKRQHFVPRVYMKAWETTVETSKEPNKKFKGVYVFENSQTGEGANRNSILWKPHIYTINYRFSFICQSCPRVTNDFVDMIYNLLRTNFKQPVYGKFGYSIIKTKKSIYKHFKDINNWDFYYDDGNKAPQSGVMNQIEALNCYILEDAFDNFLEKQWEITYTKFISAVREGTPVAIGRSERRVSFDIAGAMLDAFFIMLCRNPQFDAMGIYTEIKESILYPACKSLMKNNPDENMMQEDQDGKEIADELMTGIWFSELYRMFFKRNGGFYHQFVAAALKGCQMILFEAYEGAGYFITSDNPAFEHVSWIEKDNNNGFYFPISSKHLVFIARGNEGIDVVDYRFANTETIRHFNRIITQHKTECIISNQKTLSNIM